jgi:2-polyprenyl-6-hydroxyphenyl methylase/3-demethylubiquinone-9 3-methyltransferase
LKEKVKFLDIGCGAGWLANALSEKGHEVTGIDLSEKSLEIARKTDPTEQVTYLQAHAYSLPFSSGSFDAVSALDLLEHVEEPELVIAEAARVLRPGGFFFFHTFNRTPLSYLLIIKGVDWFVPNPPKAMHLYSLFIRPSELKEMLGAYKLQLASIEGFRPSFNCALLSLPFQRRISPDLTFRFSKNLLTGYTGYAIQGAIR